MSYYMTPRGIPRGDFASTIGKIWDIGKTIGGAIFGHPSAAGAAGAGAGGIMTRIPETVSTIARRGGQMIRQHPVLSAAGAGAAISAGSAIGRTFGKPVPGAGPVVGGKQYRRMNVCNVRALRRSLRRIHGFSRIARKVISFTHPGQRGRMRYKFRRKKRSV